jgi:Cu/Ag efflux protein CusF
MASICCIGPVLATSLGIVGLGALASFAVYRNYFIGLALLALGYSFFATLRKKYQAGTLNLENYRFGKEDLLLIVTTLLVLFAIFFPQIQALSAAQGAASYEGRGAVVSLEEKGKKITLKHDEIKGLMAAMTMEFTVRSSAMLDSLRPGDSVRFTLRPEGADFVIEKIEKEQQ